MKNQLITLLMVAPILASCSSIAPYEHNLSIIAPTGAPAVAFYKYAEDPLFETNADAATGILPTMVKASKDIVVLPTNAGIQAIVNKGVNYQIAATITFGNLFVCATGHDADGVMDKDDYIVLFQQGNLPDLLFHYVYGTELNDGIHYVTAASDASKCLASGINLADDNHPVDYVLLAEPAVSTVLGQKPDRSVYSNIQELYKQKSNGLEMFQASVFVNKDSDKELVKSFLNSLKEDIEAGLKNSESVVEGIKKASNPSSFYGVNPDIIPSVIGEKKNGLGLGFKYAKENKAGIDKFLSIFNIAETNEEIYF